MFFSPEIGGAFRQGEIISNVIQFIYDPDEAETLGATHSFAVILSQDCDLQRVFDGQGDDGQADSLLLMPASPLDEGRRDAGLNTKLWSPTKNNDNPRFHVLQGCVPANDISNIGIPHLLIDFRKYFVLTHRQLTWQIENSALLRRSCLISPYREHLQQRAMNYLGRVPLDPPHNVSGVAVTSLPAPPDASESETGKN